jgi:flagellar protein FlaG
MITDVTSSIPITGQQSDLLRQLPSLKTDNIVRINFEERQDIARSENSSEPRSATNDKALQSPDKVDESINELNNSAQVVSRNLEFRIDQESGRTIITVRDSSSKEIIRQIPSEKLLEISERLKDLQTSNNTSGTNSGILFTSQT